jgi:hypothetical protein
VSALWIDRIVVAVIVAVAGIYLVRRAARRLSLAFARGRQGTGACDAVCGCGTGGDAAPASIVRPERAARR